ncbi:hypothetical protein E2C01_000781 [Portunus trituberculatus]|uniref:Uncharacterized protein n=1 Tax=Portunus trituberculatus TaxID=210409 RepID=A0A5B7CHI4_PORTR|nr:hypothetical protein [Portunus trituberculatus]
MVTTALIVMATAGLDSMEVLVGVGVGLAGLGVGVARVGYRLNVDDIAPVAAWRITKILDAAGVVTAALSPLVVAALAQELTSQFFSTRRSAPHSNLGRGVYVACGVAGWQQRVGGRVVGASGCPAPRGGRPPLPAHLQPSALGQHSVASSSTFKSDGADMHSVVDEADGITSTKKQPGHQFGSMLVNGCTADRTSVWLSSHHDLVLEAGGEHASSKRADTHATNAIFGLLW